MKNSIKLTRAEQTYFKLIKSHLEEIGILKDVDEMIISLAAKTRTRIIEASAELDEKGTTQKYSTGATNVSPQLTVYQKLVAEFEKHCYHLGLSPKARDLMKLQSERKKKADPLAKFLSIKGKEKAG